MLGGCKCYSGRFLAQSESTPFRDMCCKKFILETAAIVKIERK